MVKEERNNEYVLNEYKCGWCGYKWQQYVRRLELGNNILTGKPERHSVSSQVQCKSCMNFAKTWEGCKEISRVNVKGIIANRVVKV